MTTCRGGKTGANKPAGGLPDEPLSDPLVVLRHLDRLFWRHFHIPKRQLVNFCRAGCPTDELVARLASSLTNNFLAESNKS
jgi:hypothetical protein